MAKVLGAKNVIDGLRKLNRFFDVLKRVRPEEIELQERLREALKDQVVGEFAFGFVPTVFPGFRRGLRLQIVPRHRKHRPRWGGRFRRFRL